jgi:hypothetical protein
VGFTPKIHLTNTEIIAIYDQPDIAGRLLILGNPGIGKTTVLLKLAEELVKRAKNDSKHPISVLFAFSSWKNDSHSIKDWLVDQLKHKYGVRKDIGKQLVENQEILPLLDGLDELAAERQEKCVVKINDFINAGWSNPLVICSRIQEYQRYKALLQLNNSLELCLFTQEQVNQYLQNTDNLQLSDSINQDEELSKLAKTPLLLNIIVLSAQELSIETWQQLKSSPERLSYLFEVYIIRMLKRQYRGKQPDPEKTKRWLSWLAQRLKDESATEFLIEKIQPSWLKKKIQKFVYNLTVWGLIGALISGLISGLINGLILGAILDPTSDLINGLILGLIYGLIKELIDNQIEKIRLINYLNISRIKTIKLLISGLISGLINGLMGVIYNGLIGLISGLISGVILGLIFGVIGDEIQIVEILKFSRKNSSQGLITGLITGLILGMIFGLINGLINGLITGLITGLVLGLILAIEGVTIENKTIPNQGIRQSVVNIVIISTLTCLLATLILTLGIKILEWKLDLSSSPAFGLFLGLLIAIARSGTPAIKHFVLRVILWANGYAPWNYAKFLDYCTDRLFLQRVGGGYRFMHDLLRQHFANYSVPRNLAPIQETTVASSVLIPDYISCTSCGHHNSTNCKFCTRCGMGLNKPDI